MPADLPDWTAAPVANAQTQARIYLASAVSIQGTLIAAVAGRSIVLTLAQLTANGLSDTLVRGQVIGAVGWGDMALGKHMVDLAIAPNSPSCVVPLPASASVLPVGQAAIYNVTPEIGVGVQSVLLAVSYYLQ